MHLFEVHHLSAYQDQQCIIHDVNFSIEKNQLLIICGKSGAGKSTLLQEILKEINDSRILWCGNVLDKNTLIDIIGFQPQYGGLLSDQTIIENVAMPLISGHGIQQNLAYQLALDRLALFGFPVAASNKLPYMLSGGMTKLAALARASICDPELLILDEPTSGLDPINTEKFCEALDIIRTQSAILCITHVPLRPGDMYGVLHEGTFTYGTASELMCGESEIAFLVKRLHGC